MPDREQQPRASDTSSVVSITGRSDTHRVVIDFDYGHFSQRPGLQPPRWLAGWFDNDGDMELLRGKIILTVDPEFDGDHTVLHVTGVELAQQQDNSIAYGRERHCDEDHDGSHWHCSRCGAVCSSEGHEPSMCELARKRGKDRPGFAGSHKLREQLPDKTYSIELSERELHAVLRKLVGYELFTDGQRRDLEIATAKLAAVEALR